MGIPREGTFKLTVTRLVSYSYTWDGQQSYIAGAGKGLSENVFSPDIDVTFNGETISFTDSTDVGRSFEPAVICAFSYYPDVIFVYDARFPVAWYCISLASFDLNALDNSFVFNELSVTTRSSEDSLPRGTWNVTGTFIPFIETDDTSFIDFGAPECFLPGTLIELAEGEKRVEDIRPGDFVKVRSGRYKQSATVVWVGTQIVRVHTNLSPDLAGYPIVIKANAIAPGKPKRDLRLTSEHCVFFKGHLLPARTLVNGKSIFYDMSRETFTVYHLETLSHAIIFAEGLAVETFHDSGQRARFKKTQAISPNYLSTFRDAATTAYPIGMPPQDLKKIWSKIMRRVGTSKPPVGDSIRKGEKAFSPQLKVKGDRSGELEVRQIAWHTYRVDVARREKRVTFCSPSFRFCDLHGPFYDDRRRLGILVEQIKLSARAVPSSEITDMRFSLGKGWHGDGQNWPCWTDGAGEILLLPDEETPDETQLELEIRLIDCAHELV